MKILHLNYSDIKGGAAIAMNRLHQSLLDQNINSKVLVFEKKLYDKSIICETNNLEKKINLIKRRTSFQLTKYQKINSKITHSLNIFNSNIKNKVLKLNPDILHLHWVNNEFISVKQIGQFKFYNIPIVWTMHDMWPYCGAEHYTFEKRFISGYKNSNKTLENYGLDINKHIWKLKYLHWKNIKMNIICPSKWQLTNVKSSKIFKKKNIFSIPLGIDIKKFKLINKKFAKKKLNLKNNYKYLLFGSAESPINDRKGLDFIINLVSKVNLEKTNIAILFFGQTKPEIFKNIKIPCFKLNNIKENDYNKLNLIFSACELTLVPSKIESFGLIALESLASGTPVITFKNIGTSDLVIHKKNGYLSKYLNYTDFYKGIKWFFSLSLKEKKKISKFSRNHIKKKFNISKISQEHINLYKKIKNDFKK